VLAIRAAAAIITFKRHVTNSWRVANRSLPCLRTSVSCRALSRQALREIVRSWRALSGLEDEDEEGYVVAYWAGCHWSTIRAA
jgi:hypothetical protein